jgi:hypothetical protein
MQCSLRPSNFISFVWGRQNSLVFTPFCSTSGSVQNNRSPHFHQFCFQQHEEHAILIGGATCSRQHFAINPCSFYLWCAQEHHRFQSTRFALYLNELSYFGVGEVPDWWQRNCHRHRIHPCVFISPFVSSFHVPWFFFAPKLPFTSSLASLACSEAREQELREQRARQQHEQQKAEVRTCAQL